jgi:hypothetical protein
MSMPDHLYIIKDEEEGLIEKNIYEHKLPIEKGCFVHLDLGIGETLYRVTNVDQIWDYANNRMIYTVHTKKSSQDLSEEILYANE